MKTKIAIAVVLVGLGCSSPPQKVARYRCIVTLDNEVLCFQPDGVMFRPERRYARFILEVPIQ